MTDPVVKGDAVAKEAKNSEPAPAKAEEEKTAKKSTLDLKQFEKAFEDMKLKNSLVDAREGIQTFIIYVNNIQKHPAEPRYRRIRVENANYQERLGHLKGGQKLLELLGYRENGSGFLELPKELHPLDDQADILAIQKVAYAVLDQTDEQFQNVPWYEPDNSWGCCTAASEGHDIGTRPTMEDNFMHIDGFASVKDQGFFAIYDGHGGKQTVDFLTCGLHLNLAYHLKTNPKDCSIKDAFLKVYEHTDAQIRRQQILQSGATAVTVLLRTEDEKRVIYCANAGDTRAVLCCKDGKAKRVTKDHKASDKDEKKRIEESGGFVTRGDRVNGLLAVSRAFGDHMLKPAVSVKPYQEKVVLTADNPYLVVACDGLWDVMEDQVVIDFINKRLEAEFKGGIDKQKDKKKIQLFLNKLIAELIKAALDKRSQDNISIMIVYF